MEFANMQHTTEGTHSHTRTHKFQQACAVMYVRTHTCRHTTENPFLTLPLSLSLTIPCCQSSKDNEAVEKVMNDLDANNDGEVDFTEFIILMGALTVACNDFFLEFKSDDQPKEQSSAEKKD